MTKGRGRVDFFDRDGVDLLAGFENGATGDHREFGISAYGVRMVNLSPASGALAVGYARVESDVPLGVKALLRVLNGDGEVISEVDMEGVSGKVLSVGPVEIRGPFNTGLALVNTWMEGATVQVALLSDMGRVSRSVPPVTFELSGGAHLAKFVSELFPEIGLQEFQGSVRISSDKPIAAMILQTKSGLPVSSLPVVSSER